MINVYPASVLYRWCKVVYNHHTFIQVSVWSVYFYLHICYCFLLLSRSQIKSSIVVDEVIDGCISQKSICLYLWIKSQK